MVLLNDGPVCKPIRPMIEEPTEIFRVIDDGTCVLTTLSPRKALLKLMEIIDKYEINHCWAESEKLQ